jgi:putative nucleotidyltransferase with HDIG domain
VAAFLVRVDLTQRHVITDRERSIDFRTVLTTVAFAMLGAGSVVLAVAYGVQPDSTATVLMLAACALVTERRRTRLSGRLNATATGQLIVLAAVTSGPVGAAIVALAAQIGDPPPPLARWVTYTGLYATQGVAAGFAAQAVAPIGSTGASAIAGQAICAAVAVFAVNFGGNAIVSWVRGIANLRRHLGMVAAGAGGGCVFSAPLVAILAYGYGQAGLAVLLLALVPILAAVGLLGLYREKTELARRLSEGNMAFALALVRALDERDPYTAGHSAAVAVYARDLARAAGYEDEQVAMIQLAALLHDVGKIAVPLEILTKPGRLSDEEWAEIRQHPEIGERITGEAPVFQEIARLIRYHHERPDGRGYPDGLNGSDIPEEASIIGLADAYSAMTQPRAYRPAMPPELAIAELRRCAGTQFTSRLVELFVGCLDSAPTEYREGAEESFSLDGQRQAILSQLGDGHAALVGAAT